MQKWEYYYVVIGFERLANGKWAVSSLDGQTLGTKPTMAEFLNQIGSDGWELITIDQGSTHIFKRPKP